MTSSRPSSARSSAVQAQLPPARPTSRNAIQANGLSRRLAAHRAAAAGAMAVQSRSDLGKKKELCDPLARSRQPDSRAKLHELRDALRPLSPKRSRYCGVSRLPKWGPVAEGAERSRVDYVDVMTRETANGTRAHFHGTLRCGSPFTCPTCSATLRASRADDVVTSVKYWRSEGGSVELLTLTMRHGLGDDLHALNRARQAAWRKCTQGESWKRLAARLGVVHYVRGTDDTYGAHGWHPHFHTLLFTRPTGGPRARALALRDLRGRWQRCVTKVLGARHSPSWRGVDLRECRRDEYIAKLGLEIVAPDTKKARRGGVTPWEIAAEAAAGDGRAVGLWRAYSAAMKGVRQLTWSRGLREAAGIGAELSDQELIDGVDQLDVEQHVASIPAAIWDEIGGARGALFAIKRGAEASGVLGVAAAIAQYRWGLAPPEPGESPDQLVLDLVMEIRPRPSSTASSTHSHQQVA